MLSSWVDFRPGEVKWFTWTSSGIDQLGLELRDMLLALVSQRSASCFLHLLWTVPSSQRAVSGAACPPSCPHSGLEEEACYRSGLSVLAVQHQANCSMPAQSIQCLARVRMKIATPTRQDWKRKNLAHTFPLRADFSSLSFFFFFFLFFFFFKGGNPPVYKLKSKMHKWSVRNSVTHEHLWAWVLPGNWQCPSCEPILP